MLWCDSVCVCVCVCGSVCGRGGEGNESVFVCACVGVREWVLASRKKRQRQSRSGEEGEEDRC